jgi:indole-3-glycerol phosphate synthase
MLLIVAALPGNLLQELYELGTELGMQILVEVHDQEELERALAINPQVIGVNARNLKTLEIDLANFTTLIPQIPSHIYRVAESGIATKADVETAAQSGADAILVGETLVKSGKPEETIAEFLSVGKR